MLRLPSLSPIDSKRIEVKFDDGLLSSDGGVLALREVEKQLAVAHRLAARLVDRRNLAQVTHNFADIVRFRLLTIAGGYEDAIDANALRGVKARFDAAPRQGKLRRFKRVLRRRTSLEPGEAHHRAR